MNQSKPLTRRLKRPFVVFIVGVSIVFLCVTILFQVTGVLSSSRSYSDLFAEAKSLGIPTSEQEYLAKIDRQGENAYPIVNECIAALEKIPDSRYIHAPKAQKANPNYVWDAKTKKVWDSFQPSLTKLLAISSDAKFFDSSRGPFVFGPSVIREQHVHAIKGFACSLANSGRVDEASKLYVLCATLWHWQGTGIAVHRQFELIRQLELVDDLSERIRLGGDTQAFRQAIVQICEIGLKPFDFSRDYWSHLNSTIFDPKFDRIGVQWVSPDTSYGRSLLWLNVPAVRKALKADMLRSYLAGYKVLMSDPVSLEKADLASKAMTAEISKANSLTRELARDVIPTNFASHMLPLVKSLEAAKKKYQ